MGTRGPIRDPDSRRGRREAANVEDAPVVPVGPVLFPADVASVQELWQQIVDDLISAGVPVHQKDAYAIECVAKNILLKRTAEERLEDPELDAKSFVRLTAVCASLSKDVMKDLAALGATPVATMRLIKTPAKTDSNPAIDDIINAS